jgi:BMFP domain-containing protein YqiC
MTQTLLTIFIPTLMVLVGILLNRGDASRLDARISSLENRLDGRISGLESRLEGKIGALESRLEGKIGTLESRLHADIMQVIGKLTELEVRVAGLEQEQ